jgi:hypothetical protein
MDKISGGLQRRGAKRHLPCVTVMYLTIKLPASSTPSDRGHLFESLQARAEEAVIHSLLPLLGSIFASSLPRKPLRKGRRGDF